jgi:hypothetical protein
MIDTSLIGRAKELEVAGMLVRNGIYVFWPLLDKGTDLLATNQYGCVEMHFRSS